MAATSGATAAILCRDVGVHLGGVDDFDAQFGGAGGNGRRRQHAFASNRRVRPGQDGNDVKAGLDQCVKGRYGDSRGSGEEDPHSPAPKLAACQSCRRRNWSPTVLARFAVVRSVMAS